MENVLPWCNVDGYLVTTVLPSLITTLLAFFSSFLVWKAGLLSRLLSCTKAEDRETPLLRFLCCMSVTPVCGRLLRKDELRNCKTPRLLLYLLEEIQRLCRKFFGGSLASRV